MKYTDLRDFIALLEKRGELKRIVTSVSPYLEMTEVSDRVLKKQGPALLFENPTGFSMPVLTNLFGTPDRIALGFGQEKLEALREIGVTLAALKHPDPPKDFKEAWQKLPLFKKIMDMAPHKVSSAPWEYRVLEGKEVDLGLLPIQTCWPEDVAPLITWGLVVTDNVESHRLNVGIYRQQVLGPNRLIMRWLSHRGGALDFQLWQKAHPGKPFPIAVVLGADPATTLAAVTPIPDTLSEYAFAGLLRNGRTSLYTLPNGLKVPAAAEIVLEGVLNPGDFADEGPFGDHTGYYNEVERFPVFTVERMWMREKPIYHSTYTGKPPDEPAMLGVALNEVLIPLLQKQFPEIVDFYLPPEGCSYRLAIVRIKKQFPGHAKQVMMGVWSYLRQFMYTKFVIVVDDDIQIRDWKEVIWAITTRVDPLRDAWLIDNSPIDYLDFASPKSGLGSKMGLDATHKWPGEVTREWGRAIQQSPDVIQKIDELWGSLGL